MRLPALALVAAALGLFALPARALTVETLRQAGPKEKRFNIAVLGDAYRASDQTRLSTDAANVIDYVFSSTPFKQYASFFNVKVIHVVSNQNGADNGSYGATRDTALGAYFNCQNIDRLLCVDDGKVATVASANMPESQLAIVIVNDSKHGGAGGTNLTVSTNDASFEIAAHEIGHSLAGLADEYESAENYPPCDATSDCSEGNVTVRNTRGTAKWNAWINASTLVPTLPTAQYDGIVGLFEGARYSAKGVYRPWENCKMRTLGNAYCPVCTEQFVLKYWNLDNIQMIESAQPAGAVSSGDCKPIVLSVRPVDLQIHVDGRR